MAMSVVYTTVNGQIVHENRGGVEAFYAPDTLGSTAMLLSTNGTVTDTYTYWPYGEIVSHTGSSTTPFTFVGTFGYYLDVLGSLTYVRARYLRQALTRWQTADPMWPLEQASVYCEASPVAKADPTGLQSIFNPRPPTPPPGGGLYPAVQCTPAWNNYIFNYCHSCPRGFSPCFERCDSMAYDYYMQCHKNSPPFSGIQNPGPFPFQPGAGGDIAPHPVFPPGSDYPVSCPKPITDPDTGLTNCAAQYDGCIKGGGALRSFYCWSRYALCEWVQSSCGG